MTVDNWWAFIQHWFVLALWPLFILGFAGLIVIAAVFMVLLMTKDSFRV